MASHPAELRKIMIWHDQSNIRILTAYFAGVLTYGDANAEGERILESTILQIEQLYRTDEQGDV